MPTIREILAGEVCEGCSPKCIDAIPIGDKHLCYYLTLTFSITARNHPEVLDEVICFKERS